MVHFFKDLWTPVGIISTRKMYFILGPISPLTLIRAAFSSFPRRYLPIMEIFEPTGPTSRGKRNYWRVIFVAFLPGTSYIPHSLLPSYYTVSPTWQESHFPRTCLEPHPQRPQTCPGWLSLCQMLWHKPVNVGDCGIITGAPRSSPSKVCNDNLVTSGGVMAPVEPQETGLAEVSPFLSWHCQQCASYQHENITWA